MPNQTLYRCPCCGQVPVFNRLQPEPATAPPSDRVVVQCINPHCYLKDTIGTIANLKTAWQAIQATSANASPLPDASGRGFRGGGSSEVQS